MKKKYVRPETEVITARAKYTFMQASKIFNTGDSEGENNYGGEYTGNEGWTFDVGAKESTWDWEE